MTCRTGSREGEGDGPRDQRQGTRDIRRAKLYGMRKTAGPDGRRGATTVVMKWSSLSSGSKRVGSGATRASPWSWTPEKKNSVPSGARKVSEVPQKQASRSAESQLAGGAVVPDAAAVGEGAVREERFGLTEKGSGVEAAIGNVCLHGPTICLEIIRICRRFADARYSNWKRLFGTYPAVGLLT